MKRFWSKVQKTDTCWLWKASRDRDGYGNFSFKGRWQRAHRVAFELQHGRESVLLICHRCDNPSCVRPEHLFEGTPRENTADMVRKGRITMHQSKKTHCPRGHEYTAHNISREGRRRHCRVCMRAAQARWRAKKFLPRDSTNP